MSTSRFEQDLSEIPRAELPAAFRDEILAKACVAAEPALLAQWWRATPKPIAAAVAAAWIAIAALQFTFPETRSRNDEAAPQTLAEERPESTQLFVAWVERNRTLLQTL